LSKPKTWSEARDHGHWESVEEAAGLLEEGRWEDALQELKRVLQKDANNPYAYFLLGGAFHELKQTAASRDAYQAAVRVSPDHLGARVALAHVLRELGDHAGAEREAKEALRRFPRDGDAMHALGLAQAARGNRKEARKNLQGFLDAGPELEAATEVRGILEMLGLGDDDDPQEFE
jgi:tetratricopeptide (TPR) repeat protein